MADLLLEIGSEELPVGFIGDGGQQLADIIAKALDANRLSHGPAKHYGTPRRLAVIIENVADAQPNLDKEVMGPAVKAAYDAEGKPTKAAIGFARVNNLDVERLKRVSTPKGEYLAAQVHEVGKPAAEILPKLLEGAIAALRFPKSMRWGALEATYARPILWILALHGEQAVELEYAQVLSGHHSRGHRFLAPDPFTVKSAASYLAQLRERSSEPDARVRQELIHQQLRAAAGSGSVPSAESEKRLLAQVANLVEWPSAVLGSFDQSYLDLPREVLLSEMTVHQRYFALEDSTTGKLKNEFVVIAGTPVKDTAVSRHGYERVLRARLSDARFFYDQDRKQPLESRVAALGTIVFQQKLGTVLEKVERVAQLADFLAEELKCSEAQRKIVARAARLAKADLVTGMVGEFPELQGTMGGYYAQSDGEPAEVAAAVRQQYLPRFQGDDLPASREAAIIGIADRIDTMCGMFGIGKPPTGSADPFALRRACLAVIAVTCDAGFRYSLQRLCARSFALLAGKVTEPVPAIQEKLTEFFRARLKSQWSEEFAPDLAEAVLSPGFDDLWAAKKRLEGLSTTFQRGDFLPLASAFKRAVSILSQAPADRLQGEVDSEKLIEEPERVLWKSQLDVRRRVDERLGKADFQGALEDMASLKPAIDAFFDKVHVMADDIGVRDNRFRLLFSLRTLFAQVADLSQIQGAEK